MNTKITPPWHRQFWPWFLIFFPATAVVAGIITIILAVNSDDGLVEDDYFKSGLAINKTLDKRQRANELSLQAMINFDPATQNIRLNLSGKLEEKPARLHLKMLHPTRSQLDIEILLYLSPDNNFYTGRLPSFDKTDWHFVISPEDQSWRLSGRTKLDQKNNWLIQAK